MPRPIFHNPGAYCSSEIFSSNWDATTQTWSPIVNVSGSSPALCVGGNTFDKKASRSACNFNQGSMPVVNPVDGSVFVVWKHMIHRMLASHQGFSHGTEPRRDAHLLDDSWDD